MFQVNSIESHFKNALPDNFQKVQFCTKSLVTIIVHGIHKLLEYSGPEYSETSFVSYSENII